MNFSGGACDLYVSGMVEWRLRIFGENGTWVWRTIGPGDARGQGQHSSYLGAFETAAAWIAEREARGPRA